jgi:hypothetical protein
MRTALNERQKLVLETLYKQYSNKQVLDYLKDQGFEVSNTTLKRDRNYIKRSSIPRLYQIAKVGFEDQHIQRIEKLEMIEKEMWTNYNNITDPYKRILSLERIANLQPIISAYYDSTRYVLETSTTKQPDKSISTV